MQPTVHDIQVARAVCWSYGIPTQHLEDAAVEVALAMRAAPPGRRHAAGHRTARRLLAGELGLAQRRLPAAPGRSQAVGEGERARRACRDRAELTAFDRHSRHFAAENGVCPRCSRPGRFTEMGGACPCGFRYGQPDAADDAGAPQPPYTAIGDPEEDRHALEGIRRGTRESA